MSQQEAGVGSFFPVPLDSVEFGDLPMDLYLRHGGGGETALYRSVGVPFTRDDAVRLTQQGVRFLYVPMKQHALYRAALCGRLGRAFGDAAVGRAERGRVVRDACSKMIEDVMLFPGQAESVQTVADISVAFARWSAEQPDAFSYILDMSAHDYYTITHMVNVGVGCGMLVKELRPDDTDLFSTVVQGGLLHDVGKRGVPEEILNKEGKLDPAEWEQVRKHPMLGYEELKGHPGISSTILEMARDHHERLDGGGYPAGTSADQIGLPARVCAVVDVYDALTAARPYRGPTAPAEALRIMREGVGSQFDPDVFDCWSRLVERLVAENPARAVPPGAAPAGLSLVTVAPPRPAGSSSWESDAGPPLAATDERRRHVRYRCNLDAEAVFIRQGKPCRVGIGEVFGVRVTDLSQGGVQIRTDWPLSLNDVLSISFHTKAGASIQRHIRIVRVRRAGDHAWLAGAAFATEAATGGGRTKAA